MRVPRPYARPTQPPPVYVRPTLGALVGWIVAVLVIAVLLFYLSICAFVRLEV